MSRIKLFPRLLLLTVFSAASSIYAREGINLVPNGDFEQGGRNGPVYWTAPDNLTVFWEDGGVPGKCLRLDTDVYRSEWEKHKENPGRVVEKTPTSGKKYNTVAGTVGVAVYSYGIPVESGASYLVEYDMKGPSGEQFVYLKGYWQCKEEDVAKLGEKIFFKPDPTGPSYSLMVMGGVGEETRNPKAGDYIMSFRRRFVAKMPAGGANKWHRYRGVVTLRERSKVESVLLEIYAFWPPGEYSFDNISMRRIGDKEVEEFKEWRKSHPEGIPLER